MTDIGRKKIMLLTTFDIDETSDLASNDRAIHADLVADAIRQAYRKQITFTDFRLTVRPVTDD